MQAGDIKQIYGKPLTREDFEGEAKLIERCMVSNKLYRGKTYEWWMVSFVDFENPVMRQVEGF